MENEGVTIKKSFAMQMFLSVGAAIGSGFIYGQITLAVVETRLEYLEGILDRVSDNQITLATSGEKISGLAQRMTTLENAINILAEQSMDRYTRTEAEKDIELLTKRIDGLNK